MALLLLVLVPVLGGLLALAIKSVRIDLGVLLLVSALHLAAAVGLWFIPSPPLGSLLALDVPGHLFLTITSVVFLVVALYAIPYVLHAFGWVQFRWEYDRESNASVATRRCEQRNRPRDSFWRER
jgi:formate hydrogenlyase subunit 3/multisubunit Na+/H+ antiporter MnhD subunit